MNAASEIQLALTGMLTASGKASGTGSDSGKDSYFHFNN